MGELGTNNSPSRQKYGQRRPFSLQKATFQGFGCFSMYSIHTSEATMVDSVLFPALSPTMSFVVFENKLNRHSRPGYKQVAG